VEGLGCGAAGGRLDRMVLTIGWPDVLDRVALLDGSIAGEAGRGILSSNVSLSVGSACEIVQRRAPVSVHPLVLRRLVPWSLEDDYNVPGGAI
jgi:hypothetical protein